MNKNLVFVFSLVLSFSSLSADIDCPADSSYHVDMRTMLPDGSPNPSYGQQISTGLCACVTFEDGIEVNGNEKSAFKVLDSFKLIKLAVSLGSNESLAQHPYSMTHCDVPNEIKEKIGISEGLIRLSVGIENADDIINDLNQALKKI